MYARLYVTQSLAEFGNDDISDANSELMDSPMEAPALSSDPRL